MGGKFARMSFTNKPPQLEYIIRRNFKYMLTSGKFSIKGVQVRAQTSLNYNKDKYDEQILVSVKCKGAQTATKLFKGSVDYNSFIDISFDKSVEVLPGNSVELTIELLTKGHYLLGFGAFEGESVPFLCTPTTNGPLVAVFY